MLLGIIMLIAFLRTPSAFLQPVVAFEDGSNMFAFYYNNRAPDSILRHYQGYTSLLPNLVGYVAPFAPTRAIPYVLALFPLVASSLSLSWLSRDIYRFVVADDRTRRLACVVLALVPVANSLFVSNTTYSIWSLLLLLILLALAPPPTRVAAALLRLGAMSVLIVSHPLSMALMPLYLGGLYVFRKRGPCVWGFYLGLVTVSVAYQRLGMWSGVATSGHLLDSLHMLPALVSDRVVFSSLCGVSASRALHGANVATLVHTVSAGVAVALAVLVVRYRQRLDGRQKLLAAVLVYLIVSLSVLYLLGRTPGESVVSSPGSQRYWWVQRILFMVLLIFLANAFWGRVNLAARPRAWRATLAVAMISWLALLNAFNNCWYKTSAEAGRRMASFTSEVTRQEATGNGSVSARLGRGQWTIKLARSARPLSDSGPAVK